MHIFIEGSPDEINSFLYGDDGSFDKAVAEDEAKCAQDAVDDDNQIQEAWAHLFNLLRSRAEK